MRTVLLRHFPEPEPALRGVQDPSAPWNRASAKSGASIETAAPAAIVP